MRELTDHKSNGLNEALEILVLDEPGQGGANHEYEIRFASQWAVDPVKINFQNGPIKEHGVNGVSNEALLVIVIDRLRSFQAGPFACETNGQALTFAVDALHELHKRTYDRTARGVEGTNQL